MKRKQVKPLQIIVNSIPATERCRWCDALNEPHSPSCPCGERYQQIQSIGGINGRPYVDVQRCDCGGGHALMWAVGQDGTRTPSCEGDMNRYVALYGQPTTFHFSAV